MIKFNHLYILLFLFIYACNSNKVSTPNDLETKIQRIIVLQKKAKDSISDSTLIDLKEVDDIINDNPNIPDTLLIENIFKKGYYFLKVKLLDSAAFYFHRSIDAINYPIPRERELVYYRNLWDLELGRENYTNAISIANDYITRLSSINKDNRNLFYAYNILERTYRDLRDFNKALKYNELAQKTANFFLDNEKSTITALSKANMLFLWLNEREKAFNILDSLSNRNDLTNEGKHQLHREYGILNYYASDINDAIKNYKKALFYLKKNDKRLNFKNEMLVSYLNIADAYSELRNFELVKKYHDSSNIYIDSLTTFDNRKFFGEVDLAYNYGVRSNFNNVYKSYEDLVDTQNEFYNKSIEENLVALQLSNENEKLLANQNKQKEVDNLKLRSSQQFLLIFIILIAIIGYLFFRDRRLRFEKNNLQMQQRLLRSQMNPHFTFNALNTIQNYVNSNQEKATNYLLKFSRLLRLILENSMQNYVPLEEELELLRKYMDLQLMRFPSKFTYDIVLKNIDEDELIFIPPMLIQPFIENSIEHGFSGIDYQGEIKIILSINKNNLTCIIDDNGVGLKNNVRNKNSASTKLISDFILKITKTKVSVLDKIKNSKKESGLQVKFLIPFKYTEND